LFSKEKYKENNVCFHRYRSTSRSASSTDHLNSFASHIVLFVLSDAAPPGGPMLSFVNGKWVDQSPSLQHSFQEIVATNFKATLATVFSLPKV